MTPAPSSVRPTLGCFSERRVGGLMGSRARSHRATPFSEPDSLIPTEEGSSAAMTATVWASSFKAPCRLTDGVRNAIKKFDTRERLRAHAAAYLELERADAEAGEADRKTECAEEHEGTHTPRALEAGDDGRFECAHRCGFSISAALRAYGLEQDEKHRAKAEAEAARDRCIAQCDFERTGNGDELMCAHGTRSSKAALYITRKWPQPDRKNLYG